MEASSFASSALRTAKGISDAATVFAAVDRNPDDTFPLRFPKHGERKGEKVTKLSKKQD